MSILAIPPDALVVTERDNYQTIILPRDPPGIPELPDNFQGTAASGPITLEPVSNPDFSYVEWRIWRNRNSVDCEFCARQVPSIRPGRMSGRYRPERNRFGPLTPQ